MPVQRWGSATVLERNGPLCKKVKQEMEHEFPALNTSTLVAAAAAALATLPRRRRRDLSRDGRKATLFDSSGARLLRVVVVVMLSVLHWI